MNKHTRSVLTIFAVLAFAVVVAAVAQQKSGDTAIDPVCGMTVNKANAKATYEYNGSTYYFCSTGDKEAFAKDPGKYTQAAKTKQTAEDKAIDPVCGMTVVKADAKATYEYKGATYYFCSTGCKDAFVKDPEKYLKASQEAGAMPMGGMHGMRMGQGQKAEGTPMAGHGMMAGGKGMGMGQGMAGMADCPFNGADVEWKTENTKDGVTVKITSKNPETVKAIQEHMAAMKKMKDEAGKAPEAAGCPNCPMKKGARN